MLDSNLTTEKSELSVANTPEKLPLTLPPEISLDALRLPSARREELAAERQEIIDKMNSFDARVQFTTIDDDVHNYFSQPILFKLGVLDEATRPVVEKVLRLLIQFLDSPWRVDDTIDSLPLVDIAEVKANLAAKTHFNPQAEYMIKTSKHNLRRAYREAFSKEGLSVLGNGRDEVQEFQEALRHKGKVNHLQLPASTFFMLTSFLRSFLRQNGLLTLPSVEEKFSILAGITSQLPPLPAYVSIPENELAKPTKDQFVKEVCTLVVKGLQTVSELLAEIAQQQVVSTPSA
jgi:hypothetical protein